ncbi:uncharacterized protein LOC144669007 [Cetorhinus maximus]
MAEVEDGKGMITQESEEYPVEISTIECENPDAPNKEQAGDLTIAEEIIEKNEATEETMFMEMQQEEENRGETTVEEQVTEGNEDAAGKGGLGIETRNENVESEQTISVETAKELEENLLEAIGSTDVALKAGVSDRNSCKKELSNENKSKSVEDGQNRLQESEGQGCREEIEALTVMKDIGLSTTLEDTIGENVQASDDSQAQCIDVEEKFEATGNAEESQNGSEGVADTLLNIVAEPDFKESSDNTNEAPVSVNSGDRPEEYCTDAESIAGQMELSTHTVIDNGSMMASHNNGKSGKGDMLLKEAQEGVAAAHMCHDQEPPTGVETGLEAPAEIAKTDLQTMKNTEADLEIQTKGVERILETSAKRLEECLDIPPVHAPPCLGNLMECLDVWDQNQDIYFKPSAERTSETPVNVGDNPTEKLATEDAEEQATSIDAEPSQGIQDTTVTNTMENTEGQDPSLGNLVKPVQATELPTTAPGESAEVSNTSLQQHCEAGISESEDQGIQDPTAAAADDQIIVAEEG